MMQTALIIPTVITRAASPGKSATRESVIRALAYFDIFNYPLTVAEISQFMDREVEEGELNEVLLHLLANESIFRVHDLYSLQNNSQLGKRRREGNARAEIMLIKAQRIGRFLQRFPFVRAVGISGSLSKNYADENADIDFFVITAPGRLWIARTLMHLFKKLTFLVRRQHFYCMNYYIDENALALRHQNIFTAIEAMTLFPVTGAAVMDRFVASNQWIYDWLPACRRRTQSMTDKHPGIIKRMFEKLLGGSMGSRLDNYLLRLTNRRWEVKRRKGKKNNKGQMMGLITGKHYAISNPGGFMEKVLAIYDQKLIELNSK